MIFVLAAYGDAPSPWPGRLLAVTALAILIATPVFVLQTFRRSRSGDDASSDIYAGLTGARALDSVRPGEVHLTFHTYSGLIIYFVQRRHDVVLPVDQGKILLGRMLRYNCSWGLLSPGCVFIPFLSYFEYRAQMKKVAAAANG